MTANKIEVICSYCGSKFFKRRDHLKKNNFCNKKCMGFFNRKRIIWNCSYCEKEFEIFQSKYEAYKNGQIKNIFCSKICKQKWESENWVRENNPRGFSRINLICNYCCKEYEVRGYRKNTSKFCSVDCKNKWQSEVLSKDKKWLDFRRQVGIKTMRNMKNKFTKPERMVKEYLEEKNIRYIPQHPMFDRFVVDFYLPDFNIVIEVLGDYWHGHPDKYGEGKIPLTEKQKHNIERDKLKKEFLEVNNIKIHMIWESDIYKDLNTLMKKILNA